MLDRRQLPEPPLREVEGTQAVMWQDAAGKVWRYVPLRAQLTEALHKLRGQLKSAAGLLRLNGVGGVLAGTALCGLALALQLAPPRVPTGWSPPVTAATGIIQFAAVLCGLATMGYGLWLAWAAPRGIERWLDEWRTRFDGGGLPHLLDPALGHFLLERRVQVAPGMAAALGDTMTVEAWLNLLAAQAPTLAEQDFRVELLGFNKILVGNGSARGGDPCLPLRLAPWLGLLAVPFAYVGVMLYLAIGTSAAAADLLIPLGLLTLALAFVQGSALPVLKRAAVRQAMLEVLTAEE